MTRVARHVLFVFLFAAVAGCVDDADDGRRQFLFDGWKDPALQVFVTRPHGWHRLGRAGLFRAGARGGQPDRGIAGSGLKAKAF